MARLALIEWGIEIWRKPKNRAWLLLVLVLDRESKDESKAASRRTSLALFAVYGRGGGGAVLGFRFSVFAAAWLCSAPPGGMGHALATYRYYRR